MRLRWALVLVASCALQAQGQAARDEARVGTERELYARVWRLAHVTWDPWKSDAGPPGHVRLLRPAASLYANSSFPWQGTTPGPVWNGRGVTLSASAGVAASWRFLSARVEPLAWYATNAGFPLENPAAGFRDPVRASDIDKPQRFGASAYSGIDAGESFVRLDVAGITAGFSNERIFWGPGVRHALLFSSTSPGFPHVFAGTGDSLRTPVGSLHGRVIYGRLEQSEWAPLAASRSRLGTGAIAWWRPRGVPLMLGGARFYHRAWPERFTADDVMLPFGSWFHDAQVRDGGPEDNQLATLFFSLPLRRARMELFGEFARNDRSGDTRDLLLEPEHNSAWLLGFLRVFAVDSARMTFWSARLETASGRISAIQNLGRSQALFYTHSPLNQGHTHRGHLLGTPLIDLSGGSELAIDRWTAQGRLGATLFQRQMPPDALVGMPEGRARTQWDVGFSAVRFVGTSELGVRVGGVADLNRFEERNGFNSYLAVTWRQGLHP